MGDGSHEHGVGPAVDGRVEKVLPRTGKLPAIRGWDIRHYITDPISEAIRAWAERGQIVTFGWHIGAPPLEDNDNNCKKKCDMSKCLAPGTEEHRSFVDKLDRMADRLEALRDREIPDPAVLQSRGIDFVCFLTWHSQRLGENLDAHLKNVYNHPRGRHRRRTAGAQRPVHAIAANYDTAGEE